FLELDDLRINKQKNGNWIVEYDLESIRRNAPLKANTYDILAIVESLPDEVTMTAYNEYKNKGDDYRFVKLDNCNVISIDNNRNTPWGLPYTLGAWSALIQKEIISRVERSMADRLIKQVLILYAGSMTGTKEQYKPAPKELIKYYFDQLTALVQKKDNGASVSVDGKDGSGTGVMSLPDFFKIETLKIDT